MNRLWVRLSLVIIMLAVVFTSGYRLFHSEQQRTIEHDAASSYDSLVWTLTVSLSDLRSAQQAYVASGQDPDEWYTQVTAQLVSLRNGLTDLQAISQVSEAREAVASVTALVERLERVDESARDHTTIGQVLMASDLVFTDGQELTRQAAEQLDRARVVESAAFVQRLGERRTADVTTAAIAAITVVGVTFVLLPLPRRPYDFAVPTTTAHPSGTLTTASAEVPAVTAGEAADEREPLDPDAVSTPVALAHEQSIASYEQQDQPDQPDQIDQIDQIGKADTAADPDSSSPSPIVPDLTVTAQLCTDLGRVSASDQLDALLSRAGDLLNASGLIVWVRDSSGHALRPATGHGYAPQILSRLGRVPCDGESATATAYRTARLQVVSSGANEPGAMAVPLVSSAIDTGRCVGVLSAEVRHGWESSNAVQATATILAAQLATLVAADPKQTERDAREPAQAQG